MRKDFAIYFTNIEAHVWFLLISHPWKNIPFEASNALTQQFCAYVRISAAFFYSLSRKIKGSFSIIFLRLGFLFLKYYHENSTYILLCYLLISRFWMVNKN